MLSQREHPLPAGYGRISTRSLLTSRSWRSDRTPNPVDDHNCGVSVLVGVCATHSHPALVDNAYWKGTMAFPAFFATCLAMVLASNHVSDDDPPSRLANAVNRPHPMLSTTTSTKQQPPTLMRLGRTYQPHYTGYPSLKVQGLHPAEQSSSTKKTVSIQLE